MLSVNSEGFYAGLPVIADFGAVTRAESYAPLPDDWHVALCDVRDSTGAVRMGRYKSVNAVAAAAITAVRNADVRKFVDIYRQILAGTTAQRRALDVWLQERYTRGELVYGLHVTDRAQMICLVFDYAGNHLHFVDGADGGLFLAATAFKERAACLAASR